MGNRTTEILERMAIKDGIGGNFLSVRPDGLSEMDDERLLKLHGDGHDYFGLYERGEFKNIETIITNHIALAGEIMRRGIVHNIIDELDIASDKIVPFYDRKDSDILFEHEILHKSFNESEMGKWEDFEAFVITHLSMFKTFSDRGIKHIDKGDILDGLFKKSDNDSNILLETLRDAWNPELMVNKELKSFFGTELKSVSGIFMSVSKVKSGLFLNSIDEVLKKWKVTDIKNFTYDGRNEISPNYASFSVGRDKKVNFLIDGYRFIGKDDNLLVLHIFQGFMGCMCLKIFGMDRSVAEELRKSIEKDMINNNFLKNEKISLSGDFLSKEDIDWNSIILPEDQLKSLKRIETFFSDKKDDVCRGLIFAGSPGTGKTLSAKILAGKIKGTFIWVSEKDAIDAPNNCIADTFSLARELSPSLIFFEDIDKVLLSGLDTLKTQLDGLEKNNSIVTILCTNHPEMLPKEILDRPGRFDEVVMFNLPDKECRKRLLRLYFPSLQDDGLFENVADNTKGLSGAHIKELSNYALFLAREKNIGLSKDIIFEAMGKVLEQKAFVESISRGDGYN